MNCNVVLAGVAALMAVSLTSSQAWAIDDTAVGYYFDMSNELIDLPYPGTEFYGEVDLFLLSLNNLRVDVNAYRSPGEYDYLGNYITSPLVAGPNFGIQKLGINSTLIASVDDFDTFMSLYDLTLPEDWDCKWGGVAGEFGKFEFWYTGTGHTQMDPLIIEITPKIGAVIPGEFEIDSVYDFVELCPQGYYFSMHVLDFSTASSYWENGHSDVQSAFFAVGPDPPLVVPEPCTVLIVLLSLAFPALGARRR